MSEHPRFIDRLPLPRTFEATATWCFFAAVFASACLIPMQSDSWWHLRAGQEMWNRRFVMLADEFSFTAAGDWWPNHEWLSEILFYGVYRVGGLPGLTLLAAVVITSAVTISWRLMAGAPLQRLVFLAAAITAIAPVWTVRPHVFTLLLLMSIVRFGMRERYWPLPLIFCAWANLHGGVAMGFVAVCAIAASRVYRVGLGEARRMMLLVALCLGATLLTPLGTSLWSNIPESVHKSTLNGIVEWRPPVLLSASNVAFWITAILLLVSVAARFRSRRPVTTTADAVLIAVSLALLPLAVRYSRNIPPFLLVALPAVTRLLAPTLARWRTGPKRELTALNTALAAACLAICFAVVSNAWSAPAARLKWTPIPASVVDQVRACGGRLYNRYDDGGYLIWFAAGVPVFIDSRQDPYPLDLLQEHLFSERSGSYREVFDRYRLTCAVLPESSPTASQLATDGWHTRIALDGWVVLQAPVALARTTDVR